MSKSRATLILSLGILLASCTQTLTVRGPNTPKIAESVQSSALQTLEYGDTEAAGAVSTNISEQLPERILPSGMVEIGNPRAPMVLLSYTHQSCSYCHTLADEILPRIIKDFVESGKLRYQVALLTIHKYPQSDTQARSLICAAAQGKGLAMHRALFNQGSYDEKSMGILVRSLSLKEDLFNTCMKAPGTEAQVQLQQSLAQSLGVSLVPTFFLNGEKFVGLPEYPDLRGRIEEALSKN